MLFVVCRLQELGRERKIPLYMCFIDLLKAHDSVDRELLWRSARALRWLATSAQVLGLQEASPIITHIMRGRCLDLFRTAPAFSSTTHLKTERVDCCCRKRAMIMDPRIPEMPGGSTSGLHQPGRHCFALMEGRAATRVLLGKMCLEPNW